MLTFLRLLLTISYVTCFHVCKVDFDESGSALSGLSKFLPAAGLVIGLALIVSAFTLNALHAPCMVTAALLTALWFVFTNGLHLDGLMDAADGIFSHQSRERMLEIMADPRVGNFGVITGTLLLMIKFASLGSMSIASLYMVLAIIPAWARFAEVYAIGNFPYLREQGKGKIWHDTTAFPRDLWLSSTPALIATLAVIVISGHILPLVAVSAATICSGVICSHWLSKKLGGQTGDTYGAVVELAEAAGLLTAAALVH